MLDYGPCGLSGLPVPEGTHLHGSLTGKIWLMLGGCSLGELPANFLAMALDALGLDFRGTFFLDPRGALLRLWLNFKLLGFPYLVGILKLNPFSPCFLKK